MRFWDSKVIERICVCGARILVACDRVQKQIIVHVFLIDETEGRRRRCTEEEVDEIKDRAVA